jgi:hypothetical protein
MTGQRAGAGPGAGFSAAQPAPARDKASIKINTFFMIASPVKKISLILGTLGSRIPGLVFG